MTNTREQIIQTTGELIESQGYHATGLNQIVQESGAPKGSLYYYFPQGKEAIVEEAIHAAGRQTAQRIRESLAGGAPAGQAVREFVHTIANHVEASGFRMGGPLMTVAMETAVASPRLNLACREAYAMLCAAFEESLIRDGRPPEEARRLALFINASIEGGVILSRTEHSGDPLRQVGDLLARLIECGV